MANFGKTKIWRKTRVQFQNALEKLEALNALYADFIKPGSLLQQYGKTLEQESIRL